MCFYARFNKSKSQVNVCIRQCFSTDSMISGLLPFVLSGLIIHRSTTAIAFMPPGHSLIVPLKCSFRKLQFPHGCPSPRRKSLCAIALSKKKHTGLYLDFFFFTEHFEVEMVEFISEWCHQYGLIAGFIQPAFCIYYLLPAFGAMGI